MKYVWIVCQGENHEGSKILIPYEAEEDAIKFCSQLEENMKDSYSPWIKVDSHNWESGCSYMTIARFEIGDKKLEAMYIGNSLRHRNKKYAKN